MTNLRKLSLALGAVAGIVMVNGYALAQATRTWVSGVGSDANPCSRTAPCQTFAGAISKTATAGEINCLDPGGFGGLTITKSIMIRCDYTEGGVLSAGAGVNGFVINIPVTSTVFLSGLDFNGAGSAQNGIRIITGGIVQIQNSTIRNYRATNGLGMSIQPAGALQLSIANTTIADNGTGATGGGILVQPTGAGGSARVSLDHVSIRGNSNNAMFINTTGNTAAAGISAIITNSSFEGSTNGLTLLTPVGTTSAVVMLNDSNVFNNTGVGLRADGSAARMRVGNTTITGNGTGVTVVNGGIVFTYGTNRLDFNTVDGAFQAPPLAEE